MTALQTTPAATTATPAEVRRSRRPRMTPGRFLAWALMLAALVVTIFPFYWMIRTSLSNGKSLLTEPGNLLPVDFTTGPFQRVLGIASPADAIAEGGSGASLDFWLYLRNSLIYATTVTVGQIFFCALAAYAFARLHWPGRDKLFFIFLTALMVPTIFTILPNFLLIRELGLLNTMVGLVLPQLLMAPFAIFFLRQFFLGINGEVEEAAKIDGASHLRIFFRIILPMSTAPMVTLAILTYITTWNDYFWPLLVGGTENSRVLTVALGIFNSQSPGGAPDWAGLMAATLVAALPILLLFFIFGKRVIDSIGFSGLK